MMQYIKTQIEVNFTQILDLGDTYKPIFAPYLRQAELQLSDEGGRFRSITLLFRDEGYSIFCEWNRLLLTCDGQAALTNTHGALFVFTQILEKLKALPLFGRCINIAYGQCGLLPVDAPASAINEGFRKKFLSAGFPVDGTTTGGAISADFQDDLYNGRLYIGVYKEPDITAYSLMPVNSKIVQELLLKNGLFIQAIQIRGYDDNAKPLFDYIKQMETRNIIIFNSISL